MFSLGLQRHPSLKEILQRAASSDTPTRELALKYFFDKYAAQYTAYQPSSFPDLAFIPAIRPDGTEFLARHVQVSLIMIRIFEVLIGYEDFFGAWMCCHGVRSCAE